MTQRGAGRFVGSALVRGVFGDLHVNGGRVPPILFAFVTFRGLPVRHLDVFGLRVRLYIFDVNAGRVIPVADLIVRVRGLTEAQLAHLGPFVVDGVSFVRLGFRLLSGEGGGLYGRKRGIENDEVLVLGCRDEQFRLDGRLLDLLDGNAGALHLRGLKARQTGKALGAVERFFYFPVVGLPFRLGVPTLRRRVFLLRDFVGAGFFVKFGLLEIRLGDVLGGVYVELVVFALLFRFGRVGVIANQLPERLARPFVVLDVEVYLSRFGEDGRHFLALGVFVDEGVTSAYEVGLVQRQRLHGYFNRAVGHEAVSGLRRARGTRPGRRLFSLFAPRILLEYFVVGYYRVEKGLLLRELLVPLFYFVAVPVDIAEGRLLILVARVREIFHRVIRLGQVEINVIRLFVSGKRSQILIVAVNGFGVELLRPGFVTGFALPFRQHIRVNGDLVEGVFPTLQRLMTHVQVVLVLVPRRPGAVVVDDAHARFMGVVVILLAEITLDQRVEDFRRLAVVGVILEDRLVRRRRGFQLVLFIQIDVAQFVQDFGRIIALAFAAELLAVMPYRLGDRGLVVGVARPLRQGDGGELHRLLGQYRFPSRGLDEPGESVDGLLVLDRGDADVALVVESPPHLVQSLVVEVGVGVGDERVIFYGLIELVLVEVIFADAEIGFRHELRFRV